MLVVAAVEVSPAASPADVVPSGVAVAVEPVDVSLDSPREPELDDAAGPHANAATSAKGATRLKSHPHDGER